MAMTGVKESTTAETGSSGMGLDGKSRHTRRDCGNSVKTTVSRESTNPNHTYSRFCRAYEGDFDDDVVADGS